MAWKEVTFLKHTAQVHVPVAMAILLPMALLAAQRPGRGIRPWWVTCRYLAWAGFIFALSSLITGISAARHDGLPLVGFKSFFSGEPFAMHQGLAILGLFAGVLTLYAISRRRNEHMGIGLLSLTAGWTWSACFLMAAYYGMTFRQHHPAPVPAPTQSVSEMVADKKEKKAPRPVASPEVTAGQVPVRLLDYAALMPVQPTFVKIPAHAKLRWGRVWVSPGAEQAYAARGPLPDGALVVMSTQEDKWGRPGPDVGPLYAIEQKNGKPVFSFYWASVPEARRVETVGQSRVYWRDNDPNLASCVGCHQSGLAEKLQPSYRRGRRVNHVQINANATPTATP